MVDHDDPSRSWFITMIHISNTQIHWERISYVCFPASQQSDVYSTLSLWISLNEMHLLILILCNHFLYILHRKEWECERDELGTWYENAWKNIPTNISKLYCIVCWWKNYLYAFIKHLESLSWNYLFLYSTYSYFCGRRVKTCLVLFLAKFVSSS